MSQRKLFAMRDLWFLFICLLVIFNPTQSSSTYGIGTRILDDELLVKDILEAKVFSAFETPEVSFVYPVPQPITYIEILSNADVYADINFSYQNDIISGKVKGTKETQTLEDDPKNRKSPRSFDVQILIYGFNETIPNLSSAYLLGRDSHYNGSLVPLLESIENQDNYIFDGEQYETISKFDDIYDNNNNSQRTHEYMDENEQQNANEVENEDEDNDDEDQVEINSINDEEDKIIEVGQRQSHDQLLYDTFQTSSEASSQSSDHTVVFYYIDSNFITDVLFVIYGHYNGKSAMSEEYKPPVAEYSHISPNSLKATITDFNTTSLFVHMFVFGYRPADVNSISYVPYLRTMLQQKQQQQQQQVGGHSSEMTPMERFELLMKSQQTENSNALDNNELRGSQVAENLPVNNMISISDRGTVLCPQQGSSTSGATPSIFRNLYSYQTNAVVIYLLLWFFLCVFGQVSIV